MPKRLTRANALKRETIAVISCVNRSKAKLGVDFDRLVVALQEFVDEHFAPIWRTPCKLVKTTGKIPKGHWAIVFVDTPKMATDEGWHDLTSQGLPLAKVFVNATLNNKDKVSVTASHELAEMLVDPGIQLGAEGPHSTWYAYETADAVEDQWFRVDGIPMTNFVYPAWFESFHKPRSTKFDHMGKCTRPFQILKGGYMSVLAGDRWKVRGPSHMPRIAFLKAHKSKERPRAAFRADPSKAKNSEPSLGE